jgi:hypothetical protein
MKNSGPVEYEERVLHLCIGLYQASLMKGRQCATNQRTHSAHLSCHMYLGALRSDDSKSSCMARPNHGTRCSRSWKFSIFIRAHDSSRLQVVHSRAANGGTFARIFDYRGNMYTILYCSRFAGLQLERSPRCMSSG